MIAVGLKNGTSADDFAVTFKEALSGLKDDDSLVLLADIVGGSPLTTALSVLSEMGYLETTTVLGGMNLPMALTAIVMKDVLEGDAFVSSVLSEAKTALQEYKTASDDADEEDDI